MSQAQEQITDKHYQDFLTSDPYYRCIFTLKFDTKLSAFMGQQTAETRECAGMTLLSLSPLVSASQTLQPLIYMCVCSQQQAGACVSIVDLQGG